MLKVKNEKQFLEILKIISEESVKKSKNILKEKKDSAQERYMASLSKSENMYGVSLTEQESEAEDKENKNKDEPSADKQDGAEEEALGEPEEFGVSFDSVIKDINTLRSGRSTKDKEIKEELLEYYDRLDDDERVILHVFLRELSKILRGAIDGSEALDPSDAPIYADIILGKGDENSKQEPKQASIQQAPEENDAPPIKVNESQNLQEIRKRFKRLLKRY